MLLKPFESGLLSDSCVELDGADLPKLCDRQKPSVRPFVFPIFDAVFCFDLRQEATFPNAMTMRKFGKSLFYNELLFLLQVNTSSIDSCRRENLCGLHDFH
jgi:hypothetical protein